VTVMTEVKPEVVFEVTSVEAEMLVKAYVPEYAPDVMTFQEAYDLAVLRDEMAAADLEASIMAALDSEEGPADDADAVYIVNALLESAAMADKGRQEANGPWEVVTP
jgi:hypothetical protein